MEMEIMGEEEHTALFDSGSNKWGWYGGPSKIDPIIGISVGTDKRLGLKEKGSGSEAPSDLRPANKIGIIKGCKLKEGIDMAEEEAVECQTAQAKVNEFKKVPWAGNRNSDEKCVSVYIGNIPPFANNRWIYDNFNTAGRVADYFVSSRVSRFSKKPFGFVRFYTLDDANRAVIQFNGAWVDGFRLEVDLARFPRRPVSDEVKRKDQHGMEEERLGNKDTREGIGSIITHNSWISPNKSFAQVLLGKTEGITAVKSLPRVKVKAELRECGWLESSVVAKIKWGVLFGDVMNGLLSHIQGAVSVSRLGIRKVIVCFSSVEDRCIAINRGDWMGMLEDVREWSGELVCADKLWKISCHGIPITAWNTGSFKSIANVWGSLVNIDRVTRTGEDYSVANFVIEAEAEFTNSTIDLIVDNEIFSVQVSGVLLNVQSGQLGEDEVVARVPGRSILIDSESMKNFKTDKFSDTGQLEGTEKIDGAEKFAGAEKLVGSDEEVFVPCRDEKNSEAFQYEFIDLGPNSGQFCPDFLPKAAYSENEMAREEVVLVEGIEGVDSPDADPRCGSTCLVNEDISLKCDGDEGVKKIISGMVQEVSGAAESGMKTKSSSEDVQENLLAMRSDGVGSTVSLDEAKFKSSLIDKGKNTCQSVAGHGYDSESAQRGSDADTSTVLSCSNLINRSSGRIEKEVEAMMDLGNSLDIFNTAQFEDEVRQATMEEIEEDSVSIGHRVKTKRKYAGKTKVQVGCTFKKR